MTGDCPKRLVRCQHFEFCGLSVEQANRSAHEQACGDVCCFFKYIFEIIYHSLLTSSLVCVFMLLENWKMWSVSTTHTAVAIYGSFEQVFVRSRCGAGWQIDTLGLWYATIIAFVYDYESVIEFVCVYRVCRATSRWCCSWEWSSQCGVDSKQSWRLRPIAMSYLFRNISSHKRWWFASGKVYFLFLKTPQKKNPKQKLFKSIFSTCWSNIPTRSNKNCSFSCCSLFDVLLFQHLSKQRRNHNQQ